MSEFQAGGPVQRSSKPLTFTLHVAECVISRSGECMRRDEAHRDATIPPTSQRFWFCASHDEEDA